MKKSELTKEQIISYLKLLLPSKTALKTVGGPPLSLLLFSLLLFV